MALLVIPVVGAFVVAWLRKQMQVLGLQEDEQVKQAIHTAMVNGLSKAMASRVPGMSVVDTAVAYVLKMNPEHVKKLNLDTAKLLAIAEAKRPQVENMLTAQTAVVQPTT